MVGSRRKSAKEVLKGTMRGKHLVEIPFTSNLISSFTISLSLPHPEVLFTSVLSETKIIFELEN